MTTTAAAERLRRRYGGEPHCTVYGTHSTREGHQQRDERTLIDAYLALVRPDDATPISVNWLNTLGGTRGKSPAGFDFWDFQIVPGSDACRTWLRVHSPLSSSMTDGECMVDLFSEGDNRGVGIQNWPKTRGDVRSLARVLGIQLTGDVQ